MVYAYAVPVTLDSALVANGVTTFHQISEPLGPKQDNQGINNQICHLNRGKSLTNIPAPVDTYS